MALPAAAVFRLRAHGKDGGNNMPIDYSIPAKFSQFGISLPSPLQAASTLASLRDQTARQEALKAEQSKQSTLATLLPNAINQDGSLNQSVVTQMATIDPDAVVKVGRLRDMMFPQLSQGALSPTKVDTVDESGNPVTKLVYPGQSGREVVYPKPPEQQRAPQRSTYKKDGYEITEEYDPATGRYKEIARSPVSSSTDRQKPPTDTQQKYSFFASRGEKAYSDLERMISKGYRPSANAVKYLGLDPSDYTAQALRKTLSPGDIAFVSIVPRALTSILRPESGAVIGPDEIGSYLQAYIPMQGEGSDKLHGLRSEIEGLRQMSRGGLVNDQLPGEIRIGADRVNAPQKKVVKQSGKTSAMPPLVLPKR